jgi:acyl-CoA thioesterase
VTLTEQLEPRRTSESEFTLTVPDGWQQGRGAFGGLVMGGLIRCIESAEPESDRALRSLTGEIAGPVLPGEARVVVTPLRRGNAVSTVRASLYAGNEVLADAVAVLGRARPGTPEWQHLPTPQAPPWRKVAIGSVGPPVGAAVFAQHFEYRVSGPQPFSRHPEATASGWIRPKNPGSSRGAAYLAACIDAWWPASFSLLDGPRPMATITFTLEITGDTRGLDPDAPLLFASRTPVSQAGYTVEFRELWGEDGRLLALNQQTFAIIK